MFLKRLFVTALGTLGLSALAAGPVVAQDQIPAPRLYGDISSCAGGTLPAASTARQAAQTYKGLLDAAFDSNAATGFQMDYTQNAARIGTDTGGTEDLTERTGILALLDLTMNCDNPVADNVSKAATLYDNYVSAMRTFNALEDPDAEDTKLRDTARMNKDDFGGDVYDAVYDQRARLNAATKAISDYNNLAGSYTPANTTTSAMGVLAALKDGGDGTGTITGYDEIGINVAARQTTDDPLINNAGVILGPDPDGEGSDPAPELTANNAINSRLAPIYGSGNTAGYRAIRGNDAPAATAVNLFSSNDTDNDGAFDASGALQFAVGNQGTNAFSRASTSIDTLGEIAGELSRWQTAVDSADKALKDAQKAGNLDTRAQEEALRRATLGRDHVQGELDRLTRVVRSQNHDIATGDQLMIGIGDDAVTYTSERVLVDAYLKARGDVVKAAQDVRNAIANLDSANKTLQSRLQNPDNYLNQLVTLRQYEQAEAIKARDEAGGDDALQSFKDAVKGAGEALSAARNQRTAHQNLTSEPGSTVSTLLNALLEPEEKNGQTNAADDDGQALLSAISDVDSKVSTLQGQLTDDDGNPIDLSDLGNTDAVTKNANDIAALTAMDDPETMEDETGAVTKNANDITSNANEITALDGRAAKNESDITSLGGRVTANEEDLDRAWMDLYGSERGVEAQHDDLAACDATGVLNVATCANARSLHNEEDIEDINDKLMDKKEYIDNLAAEIGVDPVTGEGTGEGGMSRIDKNAADIAAETKARMDADEALGGRIDTESSERKAADTALGGRIDTESSERKAADTALGGRIDTESSERKAADTALDGRIDAEEMARMNADTALGGRIDAEEMARADADMALGMRIDGEAMARAEADLMLGGMIMDEETARMEADTMLGGMIMAEEMARMEADTALGGRISSNADAIAANMNSIGQNASAISDNRNMIGELSDDLDVVRAGVAASMALAGMPAINGRGISIGVGSYDGESAFAVGFQIQGEQASFKVGVTSSGGETGASAGVGFNF